MGSVAVDGRGIGARGARALFGRAACLAAGLSLVLVAAAGCQNKMKEENDKLWVQNRELQARVSERSSMQSQEAPLTPPEPVKAPEPIVAKPVPAPVSVPAVAPPAPSPTPSDLGGDITVDLDAGTTTVNFVGDALFDSGKATLKESAKASLNKMVAGLKNQYAGKPVKVQGHSDSDPIRVSKWKSNQELSEARAKAVRDYLVQKGVPANQVTAEGFGDAKPKSPNDKAKNRRVEIVVSTR